MNLAPARYSDTQRNVLLDKAARDLVSIINQHDPEVDVPVNAGVWVRLDRLALAIEARADLPLTTDQLMADPRVKALVDAARRASHATTNDGITGRIYTDEAIALQRVLAKFKEPKE